MGFGFRPLGAIARATCVLAGAAALGSCSSPPPASYDLSALPIAPARAGTIRGALLISEPDAGDVLDSDRIVIRTAPEQLSYLGKAQWSERLPRLVQARLTGAFEAAKLTRSIVSSGMVYDFQLATEIRRFEVDVTAHQARVDIAARIVSGRNGRVIAAQVFSAQAPAPKAADGAAAAALDGALQDVVGRILRWTTGAI